MRKESVFEIVRTLIVILLALLLAFLIVVGVSKEPVLALNKFFLGPVSSPRYFGNVIEAAIPLTFAGLAICVMFQAKQFNLGVTGSFFIGAVVAAAIAINVKLPAGIHPLVAILAGGIVGGAANFIPAILKAKWNASELVSSLMLNYIMTFLGLYIINFVLRDVYAGAMVSLKFLPTAMLPKIVPKTRIHLGLFIAIFMIAFTYFFLYRTKWGYALRTTGLNPNFAKYSGIKINSVIIYSQVIGGIIAGIGGATELLGMYSRFEWQAAPAYGFDGVIVAILARNNPLYVPVASFFLAYLRIGADVMSRATDVPSEVIAIIQGVIILLIGAERFLAKWRHKIVVKSATESLEAKGGKQNEGVI